MDNNIFEIVTGLVDDSWKAAASASVSEEYAANLKSMQTGDFVKTSDGHYAVNMIGEHGKIFVSPHWIRFYKNRSRYDGLLANEFDNVVFAMDANGYGVLKDKKLQLAFDFYCCGISSTNILSDYKKICIIGKVTETGIQFAENPKVHINPFVARKEIKRLTDKHGEGFVRLRIAFADYMNSKSVIDALGDAKRKEYEKIRKNQAAAKSTENGDDKSQEG